MSGDIIELTDGNFDATVGGETPILVDFWAAWCGPCKMIAPSLESLAREYAGRVRIGKLNVDEHGATAQRFGVMSIPTLILFKKGQIADQLVGALPKDAIARLIDKNI